MINLSYKLYKSSKIKRLKNLNIAAMKKLWGRKISDLAFSSFINILNQVALKYGTTIQKINRFYPSSRKCSCGTINKKLSLKDRIWTCDSCGEVHERDNLAAKNIKTEGIRLHESNCKTIEK